MPHTFATLLLYWHLRHTAVYVLVPPVRSSVPRTAVHYLTVAPRYARLPTWPGGLSLVPYTQPGEGGDGHYDKP